MRNMIKIDEFFMVKCHVTESRMKLVIPIGEEQLLFSFFILCSLCTTMCRKAIGLTKRIIIFGGVFFGGGLQCEKWYA